MSKSYSTFREMQPFTDDWKKATYSAIAPSDHVHRPVIIDAEGRQIPIIHYASGSNGETLIKAEQIIEQNIVPAPVSRFLVAEYRFSSEQRGKEELFKGYGIGNPSTHPGSTYHRPEKVEYTPLDSAYDHPEKVQEFITKVVTEVGRGPTRPIAVPLSSAWLSDPNQIVQENTRKYGDERDFREDDRKKQNGGPNWDRYNEPYLNNKGANTHPMISNSRDVYDFYDRPRRNEGPNARNHPLSRPTSDIGSAMEFLKESVKPSYGNGNGKEKELIASAYTEASLPTKTVPLASTRWRTGSNMSGRETKMESKDYDSEDEEEERRHSLLGKSDELEMVNNRGQVNAFQKRDGYEKPRADATAVQFGQSHFPGSTMQKKERNTYPETIDSREASRRYGKSSSRAMKEEKYEGTITSREAMEKYKGALVP